MLIVFMLRFFSHKLSTHHTHPSGKIFAWMALFFSIGTGAFWTIFPLILTSKLPNESFVGYYYSFLSVIGILISVLSTSIFCKISKVLIIKIVLTSSIILLILMTLAENFWMLGFLDIPRAMCVLMTTMTLAIFVSDFSKKQELAATEGKFYYFANIGWLVGPFIGGFSAKYFGNESVFILVSFFYLIAFLYFLHQHLRIKNPYLHNEVHKEGIKELFSNIKDYFKNIELIKVFFVAFGLNFWWGVKSIYMPLAVQDLGYTQEIVGIIMTLSILPLVLLENIVGKKAGKNGVRKYLIIGFLLLFIIITSFKFLEFLPIVLLLAFILANFGAAFIEPLKETYFFEVVKKSQSGKFFGIYNIAEPAAFFIAPLFASIILSLGFGISEVWMATAIVMLIFVAVMCFVKRKY
ncbi:hypothetical protein A2335_01705 [Candidatus Peregrinibacteria bacterium RIFOXYB2_FULL_32_7]|nr:MAG: hypothetical protein A2335_01705 [Candidatus Peregrinibacteria bacterium RIFOXYB2_FULL_32_7]